MDRSLRRVTSKFVNAFKKYLKKNNIETTNGLCNKASWELLELIKKETGKKAEVYSFLQIHSFCVVGEIVIDPTASQFDKNIKEHVLSLDKNEYIYWLCGQLYRRGRFVAVIPWVKLISNGVIRKEKRSRNRLWPKKQQHKKNEINNYVKL